MYIMNHVVPEPQIEIQRYIAIQRYGDTAIHRSPRYSVSGVSPPLRTRTHAGGATMTCARAEARGRAAPAALRRVTGETATLEMKGSVTPRRCHTSTTNTVERAHRVSYR